MSRPCDYNMFTTKYLQEKLKNQLHQIRDDEKTENELFDESISCTDEVIKSGDEPSPINKQRWPTTPIMVNDREYMYEIPVEEDDYSVYQRETWINRIKKMILEEKTNPKCRAKPTQDSKSETIHVNPFPRM